jgi:hypothetical protein
MHKLRSVMNQANMPAHFVEKGVWIASIFDKMLERGPAQAGA